MKKQFLLTTLLLLLTVLLLAGCTAGGADTGTSLPGESQSTDHNTDTATTVTNVTVVVQHETVDVKESELASYDFTKLFRITVNGDSITVDPAYLTQSKGEGNTLIVTCTYEGKQATVTVNVIPLAYSVVCDPAEVTVKQSAVATYDFLSLFTVTLDGEAVEVTSDMISTDVCDTVGDYTYTLRVGSVEKTLIVHVIPDHVIEAIPSYRNLELTLDEYRNFDFKSLFSLYVDGVAVPVTDEMIDTSRVGTVSEGNSYEVTFRYSLDKTVSEVTTTFRIVAETPATLTAKNIVTYPDAKVIDLTTLFTITKADKNIPVTADMIDGKVDYSKEGVYTITLTYEGQSVEATVEIRGGVVIGFATSDLIRIQKGTNPDTYAFESDFTVIINGRRFYDIPLSSFDLSAVDFNTPGTYPVTLTVRYNDKKLSGLSGNFTFTEYTATIRYQVVKNTYSVKVNDPAVVLPKGSDKYNVYQNLTVIINGRRQTLTENPAYVDSISCYVELLSDPLDFSAVTAQTVRIAVYPNGPEEEPVIAEFTVRVDAGIEVSATGTAIFAGRDLHILDLFSITMDGKSIPVTNDMISGKVDTFRPGVYTVSIEYMGMTAQAQVVVFDDSLAGTYRTGLITIDSMPDLETDTEEETWGEGSDYSGSEDYSESGSATPVRLTSMVIREDGTILVGKDSATIVSGIDEHTMTIRLCGYLYTAYFNDGIAVLLPDNSLRMTFSESKRPLIYFNEANWTITDSLTVNSSSSHVLQNTYTSYSYDIFCIKSIDNLQKMWYTLKINLVEKTSSDTVYTVSWGEVTFAEDFSKKTGEASYMMFDGQKIDFTMLTNSVGKVNRANDSQKQYANLSFKGTIDGKNAVLSANKYEHFTLTVDGKTVFVANPTMLSLANGGINYATGEIFLYDFSGKECDPYSYKFIVDKEAGTFTYVEKDPYFGKYALDSMYLFLDGYGSGVMNFNTSSNYTTQLTYTAGDGTVSIRYRNTTPTFGYGEGAEFYLAPLLNVLTVKSFAVESMLGKEFVNEIITDGAIVRISSDQIGVGAGRNALLGQITILTKDGELTGNEKSNCISTSAVKFTVAGFYQYTITVSVGGKSVTKNYAVQILGADYDGNAAVGNYTGIASNNSFALNKFGQITLSVGDNVYEGLVSKVVGDTLYARVYNKNRDCVSVKAKIAADGMLEVQGSGAAGFSDLYTTGTVRSAGLASKTGDLTTIVRIVTVNDQTMFYLSSSAYSAGTRVTGTVTDGTDPTKNGVILHLTREDGSDIYIKVTTWGNLTSGLTFADSVRGTYTSEGNPELTLDGFGKATMGDRSGTYTVADRLVFVSLSDSLLALRTDASTGTYTEVPFVSGNAMLEGKTFYCTYSFNCSGYSYTAETRFVFGKNGVVTVYSESSDHDGECEEDNYLPDFAATSGTKGTYSVTSDRVTVSVAGFVFVFRIPNVVSADRLICETTTLSSSAQGYFKPGEVFATQDE